MGWFVHKNWLFARLAYIVINYYVLTLLVTDNDDIVWMDLTLLINTIFQQIKENIYYTVLYENVYIMTKKYFHLSSWIDDIIYHILT